MKFFVIELSPLPILIALGSNIPLSILLSNTLSRHSSLIVKPSTHWDSLSRTLCSMAASGIHFLRPGLSATMNFASHLKWDSFTQCRATLSQCVRESRHRDISLQLCYNFHFFFSEQRVSYMNLSFCDKESQCLLTFNSVFPFESHYYLSLKTSFFRISPFLRFIYTKTIKNAIQSRTSFPKNH